MDDKEILHSYLRTRRADLLGKLDGLSEYDVRRPMTPTGTNLLGLVKHVASVELGYLGDVFGRPSGVDCHGSPMTRHRTPTCGSPLTKRGNRSSNSIGSRPRTAMPRSRLCRSTRPERFRGGQGSGGT